MIEAAAPAGTITQAFSWPPPQARSARLFGAAADLRPDTTSRSWRRRSKTLPSGNRQAAPCPAPSRSPIIERRSDCCMPASNGRERGRAAGSGRIGHSPDHHLFPARVSARPGGVQRDRDQPHQPPAGRPHPAPGGTHRRIPAGPLLVSALCLVAAGAIALRASSTRGEPAATPETQQTWMRCSIRPDQPHRPSRAAPAPGRPRRPRPGTHLGPDRRAPRRTSASVISPQDGMPAGPEILIPTR
jgi:hypothetical protein